TVPFPILLTVLVILGINGAMHSINSTDGWYAFRYTLLLPLVVFVLYYNVDLSARDMRLNLRIICIISALLGWLTLAFYLKTGIDRQVFGWPSENRLSGFFGLILPYVMVSFLISNKRNERWLWIWIFFGLGAGVLVAQTRAIMLTTIVAVFYISWMLRNWKAMWILLTAFGLAFLLASDLLLTRMLEMFGTGDTLTDWSNIGRLAIWAMCYDLLPQYYLFGMGINSFGPITAVKYPFFLIPGRHPHNIYFEWTFNYGIFGTMAYIILISTVLWRSHQAIIRLMIPTQDTSAGEQTALPVTRAKHLRAGRRPRLPDRSKNEAILLIGINAGIISMGVGCLVDNYINVPTIAVMFWTLLAYQMILVRRLNTRCNTQDG
ncbi:MAG: O-antigen ligase family protein, partial [Candidatus Electryoneaceae bacterium]|nr:O-antigen ligase family protein [Candidatus Electryoneaceae bacterium]